MTNLKSIIAKAGAGLMIAAMMFGSFGSVAQALTQAEATAIIAALGLSGSQAAAIQALVTGGSTTTTGTMSGPALTLGSKGAMVTALQQGLVAQGHLVMPAGVAYGYFGQLTKTAVAKWQAANGVTPVAGYFGPKSMAAWNAMGGTVPPVTPVTPGAMMGTVKVMAGAMPSAAVVPTGATAKVGEFTFVAPSDMAATVSTLTFKRTGLGATSELSAVYLYEGNTRITSGRTFNSSTNELTFTLNTTMTAGSSKTYSLYVTVASSNSAGTHQFTLQSVSATAAGAVTVIGVPVSTNEMSISSVTAGTITVQKNGSLTDPKVGDKQALVSEFRLDAGATEDAWINSVTLTQGGNITNSALSNFALKQAGNTVATASGVDAKGRLTLNFSPAFKIEKGNNRSFQLYADIAGRPNDTISFYVEEAVDVMATGGTYGAIMTQSTNANFNQASDTGLTLTLQGGQFTITFSGPSAKNISNTANDVTVWEGSIYTANSVEIRNWRVRVQDTNAAGEDLLADTNTDDDLEGSEVAYVQDIKIWNADNNTVIAGPMELSTTVAASTVSQQLTFTDDYTLNAGTTTKIKITADIKNNPTGNIALKATLGDGTNSFTANDIKNVDSNTFLSLTSDIAPSSTIAGNTQTVVAAGLTVNAAASPTDHTMVKGATDDMATGFDFVVGSGDSVKVNSITVLAGVSDTDDNAYGNGGVAGQPASGAADGSSTNIANLILSAKLWVDANGNGVMDSGEQLGTTKSFSSGSAVFDNLNWTIPASMTKKVLVSVSTNSAASLNGSSDFVRFSIEASGVSAVDSQGNAISSVTGIPANSAEGAADVVVTVSTGGTLSVTLAPSPANPSSGLTYGGATMKSLAGFKYVAQDDAFYVKKFILSPVVSGSVASSANDRISNLQVRYKNEAGATVVQTIGLSGTTTNVDISSNPMFVPANGDATLEVLADLSNFVILNGSEDENITFRLMATDTSADTQYTGKGSNTDLTLPISAVTYTGNAQYVYRSVLRAEKASSFVNTGRSTSQSVASYKFSATGSANAEFRGALKAVDGATTGWTGTGTGASATSATAVSGTSSVSHTEDGASAANDHFHYDFGASAGLNNYNKMSFWVRSSVAKASAADLTVSVSSTADTTDDGTLNGLGTVTINGVSTEALVAGTWTYVEISGPFVSTDRFVTFNIAANPDNGSVILVDDLRFFNDKITQTVSGTFAATPTTANGLLFSLKNGATTVMHGAYEGTAAGAGSTGTVVLIAGDGADVTTQTTYGDVEFTSSATTLDTWTNTSTIMLADTTASETLSVSVATGTPSSAGSFVWYDNSDTAGSNNMAGITVADAISTTIDFTHNY